MQKLQLQRYVGFVSLLIISFFSVEAYAREKKERPPRTPSSVERQHLRFTVTGEPFVPTLNPYLVATGVSAGYHLTPDLVLRGAFRGGRSCLERRCSSAYDSGTITLQALVANSFFLEGGIIHHQRIEHPVATDYYSSPEDREYQFTYRTVSSGIYGGLGNQWQWSNFTLGVRWASFGRPFATHSASVHSGRYEVESAERRRLDDMTYQPVIFLPTLMIGVGF